MGSMVVVADVLCELVVPGEVFVGGAGGGGGL
jgi:hypothetical protein